MLMDFSDAAKHHENNKLFIQPRSDEWWFMTLDIAW